MTTGLIIARPLPGTVGETRRVVHLFPLPADAAMPERPSRQMSGMANRRDGM
ncbi:hypothetical protein [Amycolatopsis sp. NPDC004378]